MSLPNSLSEYSYAYDESLIAYAPLAGRSESRLLLVRRHPDRGLPRWEDCKFSDLPQIVASEKELQKKLLVRNRSKVLPARFFARRKSGSRHEIVLTERLSPTEWRALIRNVAKVKGTETLAIENSPEEVEVSAPDRVRFKTADVPLLLQTVGKIPLPPYIRREARAEDTERYQSVWADGEALSAAAPTASLHFTPELWSELQSRVSTADAYLHVGRGTFEALRETALDRAELHEEAFEVGRADFQKISAAPDVFAVGTTACRLAETIGWLQRAGELPAPLRDSFRISEGEALYTGSTKIFIRPGYEFRKVSALLTNFHLPESSLFVLVSVFAGSVELAREAYAHAVSKKYRLFSYGDASLWI